jgi:hypothetical protein
MRALKSTAFKRKPKKREVSRSFRIPPDVDRALSDEARKKGWTKTFLIRDILHSWFKYQGAAKSHVDHAADTGDE